MTLPAFCQLCESRKRSRPGVGSWKRPKMRCLSGLRATLCGRTSAADWLPTCCMPSDSSIICLSNSTSRIRSAAFLDLLAIMAALYCSSSLFLTSGRSFFPALDGPSMARWSDTTCSTSLCSSIKTALLSCSRLMYCAYLSRLSSSRGPYSADCCRAEISFCRRQSSWVISAARRETRAYSWVSRGQLRNCGLKSSRNINKISAGRMRAGHPKLSLSTVYPIELPRLKFYSQRPIHEEAPSDPRSPLRQVPVTFVRYMQNKHKRRYQNSRTEPALPLAMHESLLITNCMEKEADGRSRQEEAEGRFAALVEKMGRAVKEREERSNIFLSYYKRKFLKYKCRKSIDLDSTRAEAFPKALTPNLQSYPYPPRPFSRREDALLTDGLKIEKIQFAEAATTRVTRDIVPRAKFNTISDDRALHAQRVVRARRWQIGPWAPPSDSFQVPQ